jgi:hypothetical protein
MIAVHAAQAPASAINKVLAPAVEERVGTNHSTLMNK